MKIEDAGLNEQDLNEAIDELKTIEYDSSFVDFIELTIKRLKNNFDQVIGITGYEGNGKSSLTIHAAHGIDKNFHLIKNISYLPTHKEVIEKFHNLQRFGVLDIDEAVKVLHKHQWATRLQQTLNELYATERFQNKCTIMCMPRFIDFTERFRNHRIGIWIHILQRGQAVVYIKDPDKDSQDPWHMKDSRKLKDRIFKGKKIADRTIQDWLNAERRTTNYLFDFKFPALPEKLDILYGKLKTLSRNTKEIREEMIGEPISVREEKYKRNFDTAIVNNYLKYKTSFKELSSLFDCSDEKIRLVLKAAGIPTNSNSKKLDLNLKYKPSETEKNFENIS